MLPVAPFMAAVYPPGEAPPLENPKWANIDNIGPATSANLPRRCRRPRLRDGLCWGSPLQGRFQWTRMSGADWGRVRARLWVSQHPNVSLRKMGELEREREPLCSWLTISFLMSWLENAVVYLTVSIMTYLGREKTQPVQSVLRF